jgi:hypothetical protein
MKVENALGSMDLPTCCCLGLHVFTHLHGLAHDATAAAAAVLACLLACLLCVQLPYTGSAWAVLPVELLHGELCCLDFPSGYVSPSSVIHMKPTHPQQMVLGKVFVLLLRALCCTCLHATGTPLLIYAGTTATFAT